MVSHICLLVELGPICNSMAASLCSKKFVSEGKIMRYQRAKYVKHQAVILRLGKISNPELSLLRNCCVSVSA